MIFIMVLSLTWGHPDPLVPLCCTRDGTASSIISISMKKSIWMPLPPLVLLPLVDAL